MANAVDDVAEALGKCQIAEDSSKEETEGLKTLYDHLNEAFDNEICAAESKTDNPGVRTRYRPPFVRLPAHDLFGEAVNLAFENMLHRSCPPEVSHFFAAHYVTTNLDSLNVKRVDYDPSKYDVVEVGSMWCKKIVDGMFPFVQTILEERDFLPVMKRGLFAVSAKSLRGRRAKQEDRFVAFTHGSFIDQTFDDPTALLGVFDGHGGAECASYAAAHIGEEWIKAKGRGLALEPTLKTTIDNLDVRLTVRSEKDEYCGGSTAVVLAVDEAELVFAWLGDSAGYILTPTEVVQLTKGHSPSDENEAKRVEECGGRLLFIQGELRVNGVLNLTRALGDVNGRPMISNDPELVTVPRLPEQYLAILACDGFSDTFSSDEIYVLVKQFVKNYDVEEYCSLADALCRAAIDRGSSDNVTVVVGYLRSPQALWRLFSEDSDVEDDDDDDDKFEDAQEDTKEDD